MLTNLLDPIFLLGLVSNLTALFLVVTKSRKELSEYKKLLIIFLVSDLIYTILQHIFSPIFAVDEDLFIIMLLGSIQNKIFLSFYCGCVSMSFAIFAIHFVFRAMAISSKSYFSVRLTPKRLCLIIMGLLIEFSVWSWNCQAHFNYEPGYEISARQFYNLNNLPFPSDPYHSILIFKGYDGSIYIEKLIANLAMMTFIGVTFCFILASSIHIIRALIRKGESSQAWRKFHKQLFTALLVQLAIPFVLLYFPCSFYLLTPFLKSSHIKTPLRLLTILYSLYPILDPLAVIFMISDYRRAVFGLFRWMTFQMHPAAAITSVSMSSRPGQTIGEITQAINLKPRNTVNNE